MIPSYRTMTKCHILLFIIAAAALAISCKEKKSEDKPLAYYGFQKQFKDMEAYLFDPNSQYRDEEACIPIFEEALSSPYADSAQKARAARELPLVSINRIGTPANDFEFTMRNGRTGTLHGVTTTKKYILLFFSNPGCHNCKEIMDALSGNESFTVVNIYPDSDVETWMGYVKNYPAEWISGFAPEIDEFSEGETPLYYLRAIPSLYLLDAEKNVILKDAPLERILDKISDK